MASELEIVCTVAQPGFIRDLGKLAGRTEIIFLPFSADENTIYLSIVAWVFEIC